MLSRQGEVSQSPAPPARLNCDNRGAAFYMHECRRFFPLSFFDPWQWWSAGAHQQTVGNAGEAKEVLQQGYVRHAANAASAHCLVCATVTVTTQVRSQPAASATLPARLSFDWNRRVHDFQEHHRL